MNILYIVNRPIEINTSASIRNRATICGLLANGNNVEILTTEPDKTHPSFDASMTISEIRTHYIRIGGIENVAKIARENRILIPVKNFVYKLLVRNQVYDRLKKAVEYIDDIDVDICKYDVIISSSDPKSSHLLAKELIKRNQKYRGKWIQIWGDPFIGDISTPKRNERRIKKEELSLLEDVDRVIYVSKMTLEQQKKLYPQYAYKMMHIPIPYTEKKIFELNDLQNQEVIELAYCGDYSSSIRNILPLYNFVTNSDKYHLTICGMSDLRLTTNENVSIYPRVSQVTVKEIERKADILVHLSNRYGSQIPGKIYQYSATNKPIIFILDGEQELLLDTFGKYQRFSFAPNDEKGIGSTLKLIVENKKELKPIEDFSKEAIANRILSTVDASTATEKYQ